jgi:hypothetical protein
MTSVFGTDSAYYGIANQHLYLNLTDEKVDGAYYSQILNRIRLLENNIKQTNIDRNFIVDYCKIKKFGQ